MKCVHSCSYNSYMFIRWKLLENLALAVSFFIFFEQLAPPWQALRHALDGAEMCLKVARLAEEAVGPVGEHPGSSRDSCRALLPTKK